MSPPDNGSRRERSRYELFVNNPSRRNSATEAAQSQAERAFLAATPWKKSAQDVARELETDLDAGLSTQEADQRLSVVGPNQIDTHRKRSPWKPCCRSSPI